MATSAAKPFTGTERFEIRRRLGAGGMGVVYEVYDRDRDAVVALKTLRRAAPESLYRFKNEFRALAGISHPNLVNLHELIVQDDAWFFTMELLGGVDLLSYVRPGTPVPASEGTGETLDDAPAPTARARLDEHRLRAAAAQLVQGVQALHASGRLHRDIKPSNILVTDEPRLVLLDFGVIAELGGPADAGDLVGTPAYMAPEQARGEAVPASDWYSVGVVLHEALTGRRPFTGSSRAVLYDKQHLLPAPVRTLNPDAPADLGALCDRLLARNPAERPGPAEIFPLLDVAPAPVRSAAGRAEPAARFVGREAQLAELGGALESARRGAGQVVRLHGSSGMGKSELAWTFLRQARAAGATVLAGRCYEQESVPYKALDPLIDALSRLLAGMPAADAEALLPADISLLARVFPVLMRVATVADAGRRTSANAEPHELRRRAFAALRELLTRLAATRPLVLFIDDLQWGDVDSAPLLDRLMRPPDPPAALLLLAYRTEEAGRSPLLRALFGRSDRLGPGAPARELAMAPLPDHDAERLARALLADHAGDAAMAPAIARESGGLPLFVHELARAAAAGATAPTLDALLARRLAELPREAALLLELVALAAKPIDQRSLRLASRLDESLYLGAVQRLSADHLARQSGSGDHDLVEAYHDRVREAVARAVSAARRRELHLRLATAIGAAARPDLEALVAHYEAAGEPRLAADLARRAAAQAASTLAFDRAAHLYQTALELDPPVGDEARRLRTLLGDALASAGRGADAAESYMAAAAGAPEADAIELRRRASSQYLRCGHLDSGMRVLEELLRELGFRMPRSPRRALLSLAYRRLRLRLRGLGFAPRDVTRISPYELARLDVCWSASTDLAMVDTIAGADFGTRQLHLALRLGEPYRVTRGLVMEAMFSALRGRALEPRTLAIQQRAAGLAAELGDPEVDAWIVATRALLSYQLGDFRAAADSYAACVRVLRDDCAGVLWETGGVEVQLVWSLFYLGQLRQLGQRVDAMLEQARLRGNRFDQANVCTGLGNSAWLAHDQPADARAAIEDAMAQWSPRGFHLQHYFEMLAHAHVDLYEGDGARAHARVIAVWEPFERSLLPRVPSVWIESRHLRARAAIAAAGDAPHLAQAARRDARALAREAPAPWAATIAQLLEASLAPEPRTLLEAADACARAGLEMFAAAARRRAGERLGGDQGAALVTAADARMQAQDIAAPARFAALLVPVLV